MKKAISMLLVMGLSAGLLAGCGAKSVSGSEEATAENPMVLTLSHGLSETHTVHIAMEEFAEKVEERTDGRIKVEIFPNAQLGSETESMEQLTAGVIAMTKVASPILATYEEGYNTSGARSFYTKDKAIRTPEDLKGLKIRVQDMESQTDMLDVMGGTPVAMSYGDVYTSLQTGIIDGTENNETALTTGKHGEICKVYSILEAAQESTDSHKILWEEAINDAVEEAKNEMGVEFVEDVDKEAFREATKGMIEDYCERYPGVAELLDIIESVK